jgi:hypothetical protein|tara:strand:- start:110 stop:337 length:228 start_codon:yes stop_codon:yes gene_type:complete
METNLPEYLVIFYFGLTGLIVGWAMPRGRHLKALQLRVLKSLHNFFADEEEYIAHKAERIRKTIKSKARTRSSTG